MAADISFSSVVLPPDYPQPPTWLESRTAALLLTRGKLKAFTHQTGFGENAVAQLPFLESRELAEAIIERVPHIQIPVFQRITPPLTDYPGKVLEDWELALETYAMRPMPKSEPHLPARVTAFTSRPWGSIGVFLVVFDNPELPISWGLWYLREPSAKTGGGMPFFRMGDFDDAELLVWLVLKPFLDAQNIVLEDLNPPASQTYPEPWHRMGQTLKYREVPDWFAEVLRQK